MENANYKELYHKALANPTAIDDDTLSTLIDRFPYAQALHVAHARKRYLENGTISSESALLITSLPHWLYGQLMIAPPPADDTSPVEQEAVPPTADATPLGHIETVIPDIDDSGLLEHPAAMNYFAFEEKTVEKPGSAATEASQEMVPLAEATPHEKVSLYNDDHLPYSFLWWLNKARMEHADTYRPYAPKDDLETFPTDIVDGDGDVQVLDHQIRENIFHLQSAEEKLSSAQPPETIPFQVPKKTDPIIDRFIREEPQIKPPQPDKINLENKARKSAEDHLTWVTETLANIYVEQGLYPKAIAIYKKLSLKYPEKSAYFAARITELTNKLS